MPDVSAFENIPLPKSWNSHVKTAVLQAIALAHSAIACACGMAGNSSLPRVRLNAELELRDGKINRQDEQLRLLLARFGRMPGTKRPQYSPVERLQALELMAACGWNTPQAARNLLVSEGAIRRWANRSDEDSPNPLLRTTEPVNKFPDHVRYLVQRFKTLYPRLGAKKIVSTLARAGLSMAVTTARNILEEEPVPAPESTPEVKTTAEDKPEPKSIKADRPDHVWGIDFTLVPLIGGFRVPWLPFSLPQRFPFCYWVMAVKDHYSRTVHKLAAFKQQPSSEQTCAVLTKLITTMGRAPRHIVTDRGGQFDCDEFKDWCFPHIKNRYGAIGKYGSIAVIERFNRSLKNEFTRRFLLPMNIDKMQTELDIYVEWFNAERPHQFLGGRTPDEVYHRKAPANSLPQFETRENLPASPQRPTRGPCGAKLKLVVEPFKGRRHLPVVRLRRVG